MGEVFAAKARLDEVYAAYAEPDADFDALAAEQAELEAIIAAAGSRHRAPARDRRRRAAPAAVGRQDRHAVGRREAPRRAVPPAAVQARHAAARRADQPPGRRIASSGWSSSCTRFPGTVVAITHDRYFLDNAAEWILELDRGRGIPWKGNYSTWLEQKEARLEQEQKTEDARTQGDEEGTGVGAPEPEGAPGQEQGAPGALRGTVRLRIPEAQRDAGDLHSGGRAPGQRSHRVQERQQGLRRPPADRQPQLQGAGGRDRRHHRPQRRRQVDAVQA